VSAARGVTPLDVVAFFLRREVDAACTARRRERSRVRSAGTAAAPGGATPAASVRAAVARSSKNRVWLVVMIEDAALLGR
jgi:hypothetical protein